MIDAKAEGERSKSELERDEANSEASFVGIDYVSYEKEMAQLEEHKARIEFE